MEAGLQKPCTLKYNVLLLSVVIFDNLIKIIVMGTTLFKFNVPILVTLWNGLTSFLDRPDHSTQGTRIFTNEDFRAKYHRLRKSMRKSWVPKAENYVPQEFKGRRAQLQQVHFLHPVQSRPFILKCGIISASALRFRTHLRVHNAETQGPEVEVTAGKVFQCGDCSGLSAPGVGYGGA